MAVDEFTGVTLRRHSMARSGSPAACHSDDARMRCCADRCWFWANCAPSISKRAAVSGSERCDAFCAAWVHRLATVPSRPSLERAACTAARSGRPARR